MSYKQLTAEDFADKSPEDIAAMVAENEAGLKASRDDWMSQANDAKGGLSEKDKAIEDARLAAVEANKAKLIAEGNFEEAQKVGEEERAKLVAEANKQAEAAQNALKQRDLKDVHFDILSKVHPDLRLAAQALLNSNSDISYDEANKPTANLTLGDKQFNSTADFLEAAQSDTTWNAMLAAPNTKGSGANNSNPEGGGYVKADMSGTRAEKAAAAVEANPALKNLPVR